jgi:hypothetical protein
MPNNNYILNYFQIRDTWLGKAKLPKWIEFGLI